MFATKIQYKKKHKNKCFVAEELCNPQRNYMHGYISCNVIRTRELDTFRMLRVIIWQC